MNIDDPRDIPPAAGSFDSLQRHDDGVRLVGWMLHDETGSFDSIRVLLNGTDFGTTARVRRADVAEVLPWAKRAELSGFDARVEEAGPVGGRIDLIGERRGRPAGRHSIALLSAGDGTPPLPPDDLRKRVGGVTAAGAFVAQGLKALIDLLDALGRHGDAPGVTRVLDWGCGCGRLSRHLPGAGFRDVFGCDIDHEAIAWCQRNLPRGEFIPIAPYPPTPYEAESVDLVLGYSVFTHLSAADQEAWLEELERILAPGGLLLASTHGEFSYWLTQGQGGPPGYRSRRRLARLSRRLTEAGILDAGEDHVLGNSAPPGYYRATYQSREYTLARWSERFEVLEYTPHGLMGTQDLVVMRRRGD